MFLLALDKVEPHVATRGHVILDVRHLPKPERRRMREALERSEEQELKKLIDRLGSEILYCIARAELFKACNTNALAKKINDAKLGTPFAVLQDSVHRDLCLALGRLFENRTDSLSLNYAIARAGRVKPQDDEALKAAIRLSEEANTNRRKEEITNLRNRVIAHIDLTGRGHGAKYGDEMEVLRLAIEIYLKLAESYGTIFDVKSAQKGWEDMATNYWEHTVR